MIEKDHDDVDDGMDTFTCWCGASGPYKDMCDQHIFDEECNGLGTLYCECGGDGLCVCHNHGEVECPGCEMCEPDDEWNDFDDDDEDYDDDEEDEES